MVSAREAAFRSLNKCEQSGSYTNLEIDAKIKKYGLEGAERSLYTMLVYGVTERRITLDWRLSQLTRGDWASLDPSVRCILRLGGFQILFLDRIPESAAVNESTELARRHSPSGAHNLVNAVLRALCRTSGECPLPEDRLDALSVRYSVPRAIIEIWESSYGAEKTAQILEKANSRPPVTLRTNTLRCTPEQLLANISKRGVGVRAGSLDGSLVLDGGGTLSAVSDLMRAGMFFVQDESSQRAVRLLAPKPGELVVDTCACPGGKSFSAALEMGNRGRVYSFDLHKSKLSLVERGARELGIDIITALERDGRTPDPALAGKADCVICDAPCSGLGVIAKKPEIRYKQTADIARLPALQLELLTAAAGYAAPGGRLLYSTCTLNRDENDAVADAFLAASPDFTELERHTFFPDGVCDGFFACLMQRK